MSTWNSPPQIPPFKNPPFGADQEQQIQSLIAYVKQLANVLSALKNDLEHMLNGNLDVKNIRAKGITADRMNVNELSAISANLGHIIAGLIESVTIIGSYIATSQGTYPRAEMSSEEDLFAAYANADNFLKIYALESGTPMVYFSNPSSIARLFLNGSNLSLANFGTLLLTSSGDVTVQSTAPTSNVWLKAGSNGSVIVDAWSRLFSAGDGQTLQSALNSKANSFSGAYGTFETADGKTVTVSNGIITSMV